MKLRNKLIPLASCLAVGATVAPMVTACASSGLVDLKDGFKTTISKLHSDSNKLTMDQATQAYFNAVSENPDIFVQDFNWTMSTALKAAAENPNGMLDDQRRSILDFARQSVSNVKVGETKIELPTEIVVKKEKTKIVTYHTISFDLVREQQYTYTYDNGVEVNVVGKTLYKIHFENVPVNFGINVSHTNDLTSLNSSKLESHYNGHLGRSLFTIDDFWSSKYPYEMYATKDQIPTLWFLSHAIINDYMLDRLEEDGHNPFALSYMTDPWEISYEFAQKDIITRTYNDIKTSETYDSNSNGKYNDYSKININPKSDDYDYVWQELEFVTIGSYYLSDMAFDPEL